ncbi:uncharacterized protein LOC133178542 [Saccostrea echinata]|uniref:uncharacterized protein LOC133178542 n=1 Tax=Saccostrea echinata TaxID=191078 RepID=UPI002A82506C|nr:uncharacterized protein LOC133178542 [Saccostrea echinata]
MSTPESTEQTNGTENPTQENVRKIKTVLPHHMAGGPKGLGDPDDRTLRKVEEDTLVGNVMRERGKIICERELLDFMACSDEHYVLFPWKCRTQSKKYNQCLTDLNSDPTFQDECKEIYLQRRRHYRLTGRFDTYHEKNEAMKRRLEERKKMKEEKQRQKQLEEEQLGNIQDTSMFGRFRNLFRS